VALGDYDGRRPEPPYPTPQADASERAVGNARLRGFLILIRDNAMSSPFARCMATTALEGTHSPQKAQDYWQKHASREA
jgi:hypothetical protein